MHEPILTKPLHYGIQKLYRFSNNYGASVIKHQYSYGGPKGLWELAVILFNSEDNNDWALNYETSVTDDVIGHCTEEQINSLLEEIQQLPPCPPTKPS
jgi:hypothetical protein